MSSLTLVTPPVAEPCTIADAKAFCRVDSTADDNLFTSLVTAARAAAESYTSRQFITATWKLTLDKVPGEQITLPKPPLLSVTHLKFTGTDGIQGSAIAASVYTVDAGSVPARIIKNPGQSWGYASLRSFLGTEIQFVAGYGAAAASGATVGSVPTDIVLAIKMIVLANYENRGEAVVIPDEAKLLLDPYRLVRI